MTNDQLQDFIQNKMRMSAVYQPAMIKALLARGGEATVEEIAQELLSYDQSQVEYYAIRTKNMVGKVLSQNGVVTPVMNGRAIVGYRLNIEALTDGQRDALGDLCDHRLNAFIQKRGDGSYARKLVMA
ncbi:hypothetical protein [Salibaculum griseiflavum]|uniref:Uncharacterized protein n=1 Tax=Salibaculum griseiflavum TaxID=1914409 RepID=A0A2V1P8W7_9RHOB|nr:hypothetical protein [Salibaculum griseiflavum]PWG17797.1 hypothetical protein DFK10_03490 [Salibaculum griseiflavum]